jgi:hypothetical protein
MSEQRFVRVCMCLCVVRTSEGVVNVYRLSRHSDVLPSSQLNLYSSVALVLACTF